MRRTVLVVCMLALPAAVSHAQIRRPQASVTPFVAVPGHHAGQPVRLALRVSLPEGLHTQSNKPLDPTLIPTSLMIDAPPGVTVDEIVYPRTTELAQAGQARPLAVFEREFVIGAQVTLGPDVPEGDLVLPARLRYQACNESMCFPPVTTDVKWTIRVVQSSLFVEILTEPCV